MGNFRTLLSLALVPVVAAACGDDGGSAQIDALVIIDQAPDMPTIDAAPDAPSYDFSCIPNGAPAAADATITLAGTAQEVIINGTSPSIQAAAGVTVKACKGNCNGPNDLGNATPDPTVAAGTFTTPALVGVTPLDGYLVATKTATRTTYVYPAAPLTTSASNVAVLMISNAAFNAAVTFGLITQSPTNGFIGTLVTDCANTAIPGATVTITQNGTVVGTTQDAGAFSPQGEGAFITSDVPPGDATVNATYNGMTFRAHVVKSVAGANTTTQIRPGY